jgi:hypothetical protein
MLSLSNEKEARSELNCCLLRKSSTLTIEAVRLYETLVNFYQTTRRHVPGHNALCSHRHGSLNSKNVFFVTASPNIESSSLHWSMNDDFEVKILLLHKKVYKAFQVRLQLQIE